MAGGSLGRLNVLLGLDSTEFTAGLNKADFVSKQRLDSIAKNAAIAGAAIAASFTAAAGAMAVLVKQSIDNMDSMSKLAQSTGTTVESLSALTYAAGLSDVSNEQLGSSLSRLTQSMSDTAQGTGEAEAAFKALGISVVGSDGKLRASNEVLGDLAEKFAGMKDGAGKTAIAIDIFGRSGAQLIPLLNSGREGLSEMSDEAKRLGITFSTETAQAAEAFNDNLTRLHAVQEGWVNQTTAEVLPALVDFSDFAFEVAASTGDVHTAVRDLSEFIGLQEWFDDVGKSIATTLDELALLYKAVQVVVGSFENLFQKSREWLAFDAMDKTGLVALVNPDLAKKQVADYEQVLKERNSTIAKNNQTLFELLNGDKRKFRNLWDGRDGNAFDVDLMGFDVKELAPNVVKADKSKKKKEKVPVVFDSLDEFINTLDAEAYIKTLDAMDVKTDKTMSQMSEYAIQAARNIQDALGDGLYNILKGNFTDIGQSFSDMILKMAADAAAVNLNEALFGKGGGFTGGAIGNFFGNFFGGTPATGNLTGSSLSGATFGPQYTFDSGGYTGNGGKYDPAGIVHKGEYVLNQAATRRMGVGMLDRINKGYANGGLVGGGASMGGGGIAINITNASSQPIAASQPKISIDEMGRTMISFLVQDAHKNGQYIRTLRGAL